MSKFVTLSCPSCGGALEITNDVDRFACAHCGSEHLVYRGGGVVHLSPVIQRLERVEGEIGELSAHIKNKKLQVEIEELENRLRNEIEKEGGFIVMGIMFVVAAGVISLAAWLKIGRWFSSASSGDYILAYMFAGLALIAGVIFLGIGIKVVSDEKMTINNLLNEKRCLLYSTQSKLTK